MIVFYDIADIFYTLQSEGYYSGKPAVMIVFAGQNEKGKMSMTVEDITETVMQYPSRHVVLVGKVPAVELILALRKERCYIQTETEVPGSMSDAADWTTVVTSARFAGSLQCDELIVRYSGQPLEEFDNIESSFRYVVPELSGDKEKDVLLTDMAVKAAMKDPQWRLSMPLHHIIDIR